MKYTVGTIAKALTGFVVTTIATATASAHGADVSGLDFGQWLAAIGAGLVALGGVFAVPNKTDKVSSAPADKAIDAIQETVQQAQTAKTELDRVRDAATSVLNEIPVFGPLTAQIINGLPRL